jgi:hypothetical protein
MGILVVDGIEASVSSGAARLLTNISPTGLIAAACFADEALNSSTQSALSSSKRVPASFCVASRAPRMQAWPATTMWPGDAAVGLGGAASSQSSGMAAPAAGAKAWDCGAEGGEQEGLSKGGFSFEHLIGALDSRQKKTTPKEKCTKPHQSKPMRGRRKKRRRSMRGGGAHLIVETTTGVIPGHLAGRVGAGSVGVPGVLRRAPLSGSETVTVTSKWVTVTSKWERRKSAGVVLRGGCGGIDSRHAARQSRGRRGSW